MNRGTGLDDFTGDDEDVAAGQPTAMVDTTAAAPPQSPCLIVTSGDVALGLIVRLRGTMILGRTLSCDILLPERDVSRRHAKIVVHPSHRVEIVDLGSSNGVQVDGRTVSSAFVPEGGTIRVGRATLVLHSMDDTDELIRRNQFADATRDTRTGLFSRRYFLELLRWELSARAHGPEPLALVTIVIDGFAARRDAVGPAAAEALLRRLGSVVSEVVQDAEIPLARTSDDGVSALLRVDGVASATALAELVRGRMQAAVPATVSVGVSLARAGAARTPEELLDEAERLVLGARASGGNRVSLLPT